MSNTQHADRAGNVLAGQPSRQRPTIAPTGDRADSWSVKRRISAILRMAYRVVMCGKNRAVGSLGSGAAVARQWQIGRVHV